MGTRGRVDTKQRGQEMNWKSEIEQRKIEA